MKALWRVVLALAAACGHKRDDAGAICKRAGDRYETCMKEILGDAAEELLAKAPDGIAACARDDKTVAMYRACLPGDSCHAFLDCLEAQVRASDPPISATAPRKEQCAQHVRDGLRGIAAQAVLTGERSDAQKRAAQECVMDEARPWERCLDPAERAEVAQYAMQRQRDCLGWSPALAACVLRLPGAHDCKSEEEPMWRLPIAEGKPGPAIATMIEISDDGTHEPSLAWAGTILVIADARGVRAWQGGKELWHAALPDGSTRLAIAGDRIVIDGDGRKGLAILDAATGARRGAVLAGASIAGFAAEGDAVLALTGEGAFVRIAPAACARNAKTCATTLAKMSADDLPDEPVLATAGDVRVVASESAIRIFDHKGASSRQIELDDDQVDLVVALGEGRLGLGGDSRVTVVALDRCEGPALDDGGCVIARRDVSLGAWTVPVALPGDAIAFDDHSLMESTHLVDLRGGPGWKVKTGGHGTVAGDDTHVYTVSFGQESEGPVRLLALARADGKTAWQTELVGATTQTDQYGDASVTLGTTLIAARVGSKVYVVAP